MSKDWSNLAKVVFKRTYSRADNGYLENWDQTVERYVQGNVQGKNVPEEEIKTLLRLGKERKATPAGRGVWFSGAPSHAKIGGAALNNCFSGDEKFITLEYGSVSFREVEGQEVTVRGLGQWNKGIVRSFGKQKVQDVVFAPANEKGRKFSSNLRHKVRVTPNHGWFLIDGSKTNALEVGDIVKSSRGHDFAFEPGSDFYEGFKHGLIFGDGTIAYQRVDNSYRFHIRLCDERTKKYANIFEDVTYPETYGGDPVGRLESLENLKEFPVDKNTQYITGFLKGWIEADGNFSKVTTRLSSQNPLAKQWLSENAASAGYLLTGYSFNNEVTNFGKRKNPLLTFTLSKEEVTWKVSSIETLPEEEEVYCATVHGGAFTLASGIYTSNCWYISANEWQNYVIAQDLLMLGGGVGMSVEHQFVSKLPKVKKDVAIINKNTRDADFIIPDSREGWCELTHRILDSYFVTGKSFSFSTICLRGSGEKILGFGGTASGPLPLVDFAKNLSGILIARGGKSIRPIDAADILTSIASLVVSGNVRRSALLIMGDCWDKEYLKAKRWDLGQIPSHRSNANYSVVCDDTEDLHPLFWKTYEQGEPFGLVNRTNMQKYGRMGELKSDTAIGFNPCVESCLESDEPCNLVELPLTNIESKEEFELSARTMFRYAKRVTLEKYHHKRSDEVIKRNRRVGVGITGCLASPLFTAETLDYVYEAIQDEDRKYSKELNIPISKRTTLVKPSGTISKVLDCMGYEGIHASYSRYMIQRVRFAANDALIPKLRAAGHYMEPQNNFGTVDPGTMVVDFYQAAPDGFPVADEDWDTWKQLDVLKFAQKHWADQAVSVTVYYKRDDLPKIKSWLADNLKYLKSISFLCHSEHGFLQAPKEAITKDQYEKFSRKIKPIQFEDIEEGDMIDGLECSSGACPIR